MALASETATSPADHTCMVTVTSRSTRLRNSSASAAVPGFEAARSMVWVIVFASSSRPVPPFMTTLRPSRSSPWMPCAPSWMGLRRLSR
ncbi:Uncharacterised protein [Mycobacteroides abscessus subsp. abscessus]|nr:Uncharacterised protein [Mycobacteroides abscessus subsp. abscessus]